MGKKKIKLDNPIHVGSMIYQWAKVRMLAFYFDFMDKYFERYPGVLTYMESTRESAKKSGYVSTVFDRRLYLPDINATNGARRAGGWRL